MGSSCCSQSNQENSNFSLLSHMNLSFDQEMSIQMPPNIRIQQNRRFDETIFCAHFPSIELKVIDPIVIEPVSLNSTSNQLKTLQNILQIMDGKGDSIIGNNKDNNRQKRKPKSKRVKMEDLEKLF